LNCYNLLELALLVSNHRYHHLFDLWWYLTIILPPNSHNSSFSLEIPLLIEDSSLLIPFQTQIQLNSTRNLMCHTNLLWFESALEFDLFTLHIPDSWCKNQMEDQYYCYYISLLSNKHCLQLKFIKQTQYNLGLPYLSQNWSISCFHNPIQLLVVWHYLWSLHSITTDYNPFLSYWSIDSWGKRSFIQIPTTISAGVLV